MPAQSPISDRSGLAFGLIETMLYQRGEGIVLLEEHLARLTASARHFGFALDMADVRARLLALVDSTPEVRLRVRLMCQRDGILTLSADPMVAPAPDLVWRVALAEARFVSDEPLLRHKTTLRARYETPLAQAGTDEVLFLNERGELCEGARSNLFIAHDGVLLTPPLSSGLLPGTLRARLVAEGKALETRLTMADLLTAEAWFMGNSVRGLVSARLVASPDDIPVCA